MNNSKVVGRKFLELAEENNQTLTTMQLLKLVYIAHGWMLALYHRALIKDDIQAWQYGPVVPDLYNALTSYRGRAISYDALDDFSNQSLSENESSLIAEVFELYGHLPGTSLSRLTHQKGSPWDLTYLPGSFGISISDDLIEAHYVEMLDKNGEQEG